MVSLFKNKYLAVLQDGKNSGDWVHNNVNYLTLWKCTLKMVKMVNFMLSAFCHKLKNKHS